MAGGQPFRAEGLPHTFIIRHFVPDCKKKIKKIQISCLFFARIQQKGEKTQKSGGCHRGSLRALPNIRQEF